MNRAALLSGYIDAKAREPFQWGVNDGLMIVADVVAMITGIDHGAPYRGRYDSCAGGRRLLGMTPLRFVADRLPEIHPVRAGDGDVAAIRRGRDFAFGIFIGAHVCAQTRDGLGMVPRSAAAKAFRVE